MKRVQRLIMLNQMAGPLFRELAEDLAPLYEKGCLLVTGHPDTLSKDVAKNPNLIIKPAAAYNRGSLLKRLMSWTLYVFSVSKYIIFAKRDEAILLVSNPPILGAYVWLLASIRRIPYAVLVYDIYPEVLIQLKVLRATGLPARFWRYVNRRVYSKASLIITIGNRMANTIQKSVTNKKVKVVPPWVDIDKIKPIESINNPYFDDFTDKNKFVVMYSGNMGLSHDIDSILQAAKLLSHNEDIRFLFIGEGDKRSDIESFMKETDLNNISLFPFQPESKLPFTLSIADISLVSLDEGMEDLMVPSKAFSYIAAGSALIAIANKDSELSDLLDTAPCGVLVKPRTPENLVKSILSLYNDSFRLKEMKESARNLAVERYSRKFATKKFADYLVEAKLL